VCLEHEGAHKEISIGDISEWTNLIDHSVIKAV